LLTTCITVAATALTAGGSTAATTTSQATTPTEFSSFTTAATYLLSASSESISGQSPNPTRTSNSSEPGISLSPTSTNSSSSVPVVGIVGGVLGAVVAVTIILAFAWYKAKGRRPASDEELTPARLGTPSRQSKEMAERKGASERLSANLRPDSDGELSPGPMPSGRLREG
jgi:hypothetical protein